MKSKKTNHKRKSVSSVSNQSFVDKLISSTILALAITIGISLALLLVATAIAISLPDPLALVDPIGYTSIFVASLLGGFACSKINKKSPYLTSIVCGSAFVIFSMLISFALPHTLSSGMDMWARLLLHVASLAAFPIGAFISVKGARKTHSRKKKTRK